MTKKFEIRPELLIGQTEWVEHNNQFIKMHNDVQMIGESVQVSRQPSALGTITGLFKGLINAPVILGTDNTAVPAKTRILENGLDELYAHDWSECYLLMLQHCLLITYDATTEEMLNVLEATHGDKQVAYSQFDMKTANYFRIRYADPADVEKLQPETNEEPVISIPT